ncbi:hypothetical protein ALC62_13767 [Cyphomyrmex costatus]|uniref:Uncharacterized protein n=1 Tax=Cyphomyrmex costatus TaxID=456900 RepID=A0A195C466_9HYME|nr:hypothetical protein ALC62_13767 [Cyphomyrmex costatus]
MTKLLHRRGLHMFHHLMNLLYRHGRRLSSTTSSSCDSESDSDSVLVVSFSLSEDNSRARLLLPPRLRKLLLLGTINLLLTNRLEPLLAVVLLT